MNYEELKTLLNSRFTLKQGLALAYLLDKGGTAYMTDVVSDTGLSRRYVERLTEDYPERFCRVRLLPIVVAGSKKPITTGIRVRDTITEEAAVAVSFKQRGLKYE